MKQRLLTLLTAILLTSCAGVNITKTEVATGAANPKYIYIRPCNIRYATFKSVYGAPGEVAIRKSLAPLQFANILQEELSKIAPAMVINPNERPTLGWLVEGEFEAINANPPSCVVAHIRIIDVGVQGEAASSKDSEKSTHTANGKIVYEFDIKGGSKSSSAIGSMHAAGASYAPPFDFRNAAERIMMELSVDPHRFGARSSTTIRSY